VGNRCANIIAVRFRANTDEDFVEIDLDKENTSYDEFKNILFHELSHIDRKLSINKIRKLPNILIRNTSDIRRLKNEQEIEVFFS
jgi:hypothetical protein